MLYSDSCISEGCRIVLLYKVGFIRDGCRIVRCIMLAVLERGVGFR